MKLLGGWLSTLTAKRIASPFHQNPRPMGVVMFQPSMRRVVVIGALVAAPLTVAVLPATAGASPNRPSTAMGSQTSSAKAKAKTIVGVAAANPDFSPLVTAVKQAGLVDALNGKGPYTVFAPPNAAFAKTPADQLNALLADKAKLTA